jgi:hypothetical protein
MFKNLKEKIMLKKESTKPVNENVEFEKTKEVEKVDLDPSEGISIEEVDIEEVIADIKEEKNSTPVSETETPSDKESESTELDINGFISVAKKGGFKKGEFKLMSENFFKGMTVKINWINSRQCYVSVGDYKIDRLFIGDSSN